MSTWHDDVKHIKEVVVCQGNDVLGYSEHLLEDDAFHGGIFGIAFEKHDEESVRPLAGRGGKYAQRQRMLRSTITGKILVGMLQYSMCVCTCDSGSRGDTLELAQCGMR